MNDDTARQLVKQLKKLNFWVTLFGSIFLIAIAIIGVILFQVVMFARSTSDNISSFKQSTVDTLNVKKQVCGGTGAFSDFVRSKTGACD